MGSLEFGKEYKHLNNYVIANYSAYLVIF